ncbi:MAG: lysylphosphatidylglycerol synthase transmembrane domain-containing protein [Chloroflexota bacterium]
MTQGKWWLFAKATVSAALLALLATKVDLGQAGQELSRADPVWVGLAGLATVAGFVVNTFKWRWLLTTLGVTPKFLRLLQLNYVGVFYGMVLPGQVGGEVVKAIRLTRDGAQPAQSTISIAMDRLTGLAGLGVLGTGALLLAPATPLRAQFLGLGVAMALVGVALLPLLRHRPGVRSGGAGPNFLPTPARSFLADLQRYRVRRQDLALALGCSVVSQALVVTANYMVAVSLRVEVTLPEIGWIVAFVSLINLMPIAFAGLGVREGAYTFLLSQYGVPLSSGFAVALVVLLLLLAQAVAGGLCELVPLRPPARLTQQSPGE